jgi:dihydroflavonol-4-reductase
MRVLVTGATGFVGSHSVRALLAAGHDVRLLVRSPERIAPALDPLGVEAPEHVVGDVTDPQSVRRALAGCEAVLHAASVYTLDARAAARMRRDNVRGTELVLSTAHELGLDPIVHVSSYVALLPSVGPLGPSSQIGEPRGAYQQSKADSERIARRLQDAGAPVTIVHPGMVWGPHDPHQGESASLARAILSHRAPVGVAGGMPIADVRDVAAVHAAVIRPARGPRRYLATGEFLTFAEIVAALRAATGKRLPAIMAPARVALAAAAGADAIQRVLPFRLPIGFQGTWIAVNASPGDVTATRDELGVTFRPGAEAIADTVRWLHDAGHISARQAGRAASGA